jgi:rhamnulokinase
VSEITQLAFDLGAESGRAVLGRYDGRKLEVEEPVRFPNRPVRLPDGLYWDVLGLYGEILAALHSLRDIRPRSIGVDSWGVDFGLLDATGALLGNPLHHRDGRSAAAMEKAFDRVPAERIYEQTGIQFMPINTVFQLLALEGAPALANAQQLLLIPDLLGYWLTGEACAEATNASTTQLLDVRLGDWAGSLIEELQLPRRLFPPVVEAGAVLGPLRGSVVEESGVASIPAAVVVASHDTASAVVSVSAGPDAAFISSGTWSLVGVELEAPVLGPAARDANLTNERGFGGTILLLKNVMGLWLVQECRRAWPDGMAPGYDALADMAAAAPPGGPLFEPDDPKLLSPGDMPSRIRALCERGGRAGPDGMGPLLRAIFESLACKYRLVLDQIEAASGRRVDVVHVIGGGARNALLCSLTASVTGRTVLAGPPEAAAIGNLLVQLHAFDEVASLREMRELARRSTRLVEYEPDRRLGAELYDRFLATIASTQPQEAGR